MYDENDDDMASFINVDKMTNGIPNQWEEKNNKIIF